MARKQSDDFEYAGNLFGIDLSKRAEVQPTPSPEKGRVPARQKDPVTRKPAPKAPPRPARRRDDPWSKRIPNADADYIIPDEALYDDSDDDFGRG